MAYLGNETRFSRNRPFFMAYFVIYSYTYAVRFLLPLLLSWKKDNHG